MNTNRLRIGLLGLASAVAGFALQGCFAAQPLPECSVTITAAGLGLHPYYVLMTKVDSTGAGTCGDLKHIYIGMQRFRTKASGGDFTLAVKASPVVDPYLGYVYAANTDVYNDCVNEESCHGEDDPALSCVVNVDDGGVELFDGTPVEIQGDVGVVGDPNDGGFEVDPANECGAVEEPLYRVDPTDPDGKNLNAIGKMAQFPTNGVCAVTDFTGGAQNYQAEMDVDGNTIPAVTYKMEFTDFNIINSTKVPGTAFTSKIKYTEGGCVANYTAVGFWPEVTCETDADCNPSADLDAGRVFGSGINPEFKPKCDTDLEVCVPTVDVTTIK